MRRLTLALLLSAALGLAALPPAPAAGDEADPLELDIDANIATPAVGRRASKGVREHMTALARRLQKDGVANAQLTSLRNGEVLKVTFAAEDLFAPNDTVLRRDAHDRLAPLSRYMRRPSLYKILLAVHSDDTGDEMYSDRLTAARAQTVDEYVERGLGISPSPLIPYAMGREDPRESNATRAGRRVNRRVEFIIVPQQTLIDNPGVAP